MFFFKDAEFDDLVAIIEFIYSGQVNVDQTRFTSFLAVAEMLKIKGLAKDACPDQADHQVRGRWLYAVCGLSCQDVLMCVLQMWMLYQILSELKSGLVQKLSL